MSRQRMDARQQPQPQNPAFVAHVYEDDYREIQKLVQQYPNIETGGDLFGLWQDEKTVIIQLFIGPGKNCERTSTSFHQDIDYLHRVGSVITTEEGLCNVGEWHSHHQIGMPGPSDADRRTVFNNMPHLGLERFVLFIASIESAATGAKGKPPKRSHDMKIVLRPFLFVGSKKEIVPGMIELIPGSNPHSFNSCALSEIEKGAAPPPPDYTKRKVSTSSEKNYGRASQKSDKKKQGQRGQQPPNVPRETKPLKPDGVEPSAQIYRDDESLGRKDDQEFRRQDQSAGKSGERGDGLNNENRSPNTSQAQSRGRGSQSPTSFTPISLTPPHSSGTTQACGAGTQGNVPPTTSPPSSQLWQDWNNSQQSGTAQGRGRDTQGNVSQSAYSSTSQISHPLNTTPHPNATQQRSHGGGGGGGGSTQQRSQISARDQDHGQGSRQPQPYAAQHSSRAQAKDRSGNIPIGDMNAKGYF